MDKKSLGLYIHIPFCRAKCYYCDFNSFAGIEKNIPAYFYALEREIHKYSELLRDYTFETVFIGGGTPSLVEAHDIYELMKACRQNFRIGSNAEISIETNPGTLSYQKLTAYKAIGINRLSIGLQAWQNSILSGIGRIHRIEEFVENYHQARKAGFRNINVDLIFGLPGQTEDDWRETLQNIIALEPEHVSAYSLKIEEGTLFGSRMEAGELIPVEDELDREMYYTGIDLLKEAGYKHYEISNFSKPGYECRHNLVYWRAEEYLGIGAGAHSYFEGKRFSNVTGVEDYITRLEQGHEHTEEEQAVGKEEAMTEFVILGLRLIDGINTSEFRDRFQVDLFSIYGSQIDKLVQRGLLQKGGDRLELTQNGLDLANQVFEEFI